MSTSENNFLSFVGFLSLARGMIERYGEQWKSVGKLTAKERLPLEVAIAQLIDQIELLTELSKSARHESDAPERYDALLAKSAELIAAARAICAGAGSD